MPYRPRAIQRIKGQRKLKAGAPTAKFTMTKNFQVKADSSTSSVYALGMDLSTPFSPLFDVLDGTGNPLGEWTDNDANLTEPIGLASDLYTNYNYLVVKGAHVSASITQGTDIAKSEAEKLGTGQATLARMSNIISEVPTSADIKLWFGQKTKNFQLSTGQGELTKNCYVSNGYSAKKQWNVNANANEDLRVANTSGSGNGATDKTYMYLIIKPRSDNVDASTYLLPMYVSLKLTYIIQFQDPDKVQSVPLPISTNKTRRNARRKANAQRNVLKGMYGISQLAAMLGAGAFGAPALMAARRYGRGRQVGFRPQWVQ